MGKILTEVAAAQQAVEELRQRVDLLLTAYGEDAIDADKIQQDIEQATQDAIDSVLSELSGLDVSDLKLRSELQRQLLGLQNAYGEQKFFFEFFDPLYAASDQVSVSGVETVAGDNSVDISSTADLVVGREYVIETDQAQEVVEVAEVLSDTRFTTTTDLMATLSGATLRRTNWSIGDGKATAEPGQVYYSLPLSLGPGDTDKAVVVRRGSAGSVRLYYTDAQTSGWVEVPWEWRRDSDTAMTDLGLVDDSQDTGRVDVEFRLPARGTFELKLVAEGDTVTVQHIVGIDQPTLLGGDHHPPEQPTNDNPADGATQIAETPTLALADYTSPTDTPQAALQVQVTDTPGDYSAPLHDSGTVAGGLSYPLPEGVLTEGTQYGWRARVQDDQGAWSEWSAETTFETDSVWEFVEAPTNQTPAAGATDIPSQPTLAVSDFAVQGFDPIDLNDGSSDLWTESSAVAGEYYYTGTALAAEPNRLLANGSELTQGTLGSLNAGEWAWGDNDSIGSDTVYVKLSAGDPDTQTAGYVQAGESHVATQWQLRAASGSYDSPLWDSGETSTDLTTIVVPDGILSDGQTTYYWRARFEGQHIGWSEWSAETSFTTKELFAQIIGLALVSSGGGAGSWQRVDADGNNITPDTSYFDNHPVFGAIKDVVIDGQDMVEIPKFYYQVGQAPAGSDQDGNKVFWISDVAATGYQLHPAFMDGGSEVAQFYVGKYQAVDDPNASGSKAASLPGYNPLVSIDFTTFQSRCSERNTASGVDGFMLWSMYQRSAILMLMMIEIGGADGQSLIGQGRVNQGSAANVDATDVAEATYRGIVGLWGNVRQWLDGMELDGSHVVSVWDQQGNQTWVATGVTTASTDGWPTAMHEESGTDYDLAPLMLPSATDGTESNGTYGDYLWASDSSEINIPNHGGNWRNGSPAGPFCLGCHYVASYSNSYVGGRLAKV